MHLPAVNIDHAVRACMRVCVCVLCVCVCVCAKRSSRYHNLSGGMYFTGEKTQ